MALYGVSVRRATLTTSEAVGVVQATTTNPRRIAALQGYFGCITSGADETFECVLKFITAGSPTGGSGVTPTVLIAADGAAFMDATEGAITVDPTEGNPVDEIPIHRRGTGTWSADPGKEPTSPATDNNGFGVFTPTAPTVGAGLIFSGRFFEL